MESGAIYARVSTSEGEGLQDPSRQLHACRERLKEAGVKDIDIYSERGSGADVSREGLQSLLQAVENGDYDCVCMSEISRLARRTSVAAKFIDICMEDREIPILLTDDMIDAIEPENPMSSFFAKQIALWSEEDRKQIIRRVKDGMKQAQREGKWTSKPPKGFTTDDEGYLVPDLEEFLQVQTAVERVLEGDTKYQVEKDTGVSRRTLTRILDDPDRLRLYIEIETDDNQLANALAETNIEPAELPEGFEQRIREIVREELQKASNKE